jgi:hypothetical protein
VKIILEKYLKDIRFWIFLFFIIRLLGITNPPLEIGHNWRQSLTNMVAKNFVEEGADLFHPKINMAGEKTGVIGSEFPFFNFLIYLFAKVFGFQHWYGRLINLIISSIGVFYFYRIIKTLANQRIALFSSIVFLSSIWFAFSRKIMPDTFSVSLVIIALYYAISYLKYDGFYKVILFFLLGTLGMLCKIPALSLMFGLVLVLLIKDIPKKRIFYLFAFSTLSVSIVFAWYFYWVPHLLEVYQFQLYFTKGFKEGFLEIVPYWDLLLEKFYFSALSSYIAFACFLMSLFFLFKNKEKKILYVIAVITLGFFAFILKTGDVFPLHNYYIIPFVPIMAFLVGYALDNINRKWAFVLMLGITVEAIANQQHDLFIKKSELYKLDLESNLEKITPKKDLVIINHKSPQLMYFANRKGWTIENDKLDIQKIEELKKLGAKFLLIDKNSGVLDLPYSTVFENENIVVKAL